MYKNYLEQGPLHLSQSGSEEGREVQACLDGGNQEIQKQATFSHRTALISVLLPSPCFLSACLVLLEPEQEGNCYHHKLKL